MTNKGLRAALVQLRSSRSVEQNVDEATRLVHEAASGGASYVLTPENTNVMELNKKLLFDVVSHEEDCQVLAHFRELAEELSIYLHLGAITVKLSDDKLANRSLLITPTGQISGRYDKIHMFDVNLPGGETYCESRTYSPGDQAILTGLPWGRLGLTICYDLRFPQLYRTLARAGADIFAVPSAFTEQTGQAHLRTLLRARAIETGCFVFAAAQGGHHECGRRTYGHSLIVAPWGEILVEAEQEPTVVLADIDTFKVTEARRQIPSLNHGSSYAVGPNGDQPALKEAS